jgi:hypothetical protein
LSVSALAATEAAPSTAAASIAAMDLFITSSLGGCGARRRPYL